MSDVSAWTVVVVVGSILLLVQLLAVAVCWRFGAMRGKAVVEWQDCDVQSLHAFAEEPPSVWDSLDRHLQDSPAEVLVDDDKPFGGEHEADLDLSEDNEAYADDFLAWASELGERAA